MPDLQESLRVAVRVRPSLAEHLGSDEARKACEIETELLARRAANFDAVLNTHTTQNAVYETCGAPLLNGVLEHGLHGCLFAFGQSGSGKTYSMLGSSGGRAFGRLDGVIPQIADALFRGIARLEADAALKFTVHATFVEIFAEQVYDLFAEAGGDDSDGVRADQRADQRPGREREGMTPLCVRDDGKGGVHVVGARPIRVFTTDGLTALIARGSALRVTRATGIHDDSSRSHALLTLAVERRWQPEGQSEWLARCSQLLLVDLAGSENMARAHFGEKDRAGVAINQGLLVLGRVLEALASRAPGGQTSGVASAFVPYRESQLTRLLQVGLAGNCRTCMLATISPDAADANETHETLRFAARAQHVSTRPSPALEHVLVEEPSNDPLYGDMLDPDETVQRRCVWICTGAFGDLFARCAGDPRDPLILYVHGSGPRNSSLFWNFLVPQLAPGFYHVAIDCPGYGRSVGSRQIVRSYPGALLAAVVQSLGKAAAYCLVGSSQGACAVLNAVLERADLTHYAAVCHPVGHAPARYTAIQQPVLLAFDVEDQGHPVSVGRIMKKHLPLPHYFEFAASSEPDWLARNFARELLAMFAAYPPVYNKTGQSSRLPDLTRLAGGLLAWTRAQDNEWKSCEMPSDMPAGLPEPLPSAPQATGRAVAAGFHAENDTTLVLSVPDVRLGGGIHTRGRDLVLAEPDAPEAPEAGDTEWRVQVDPASGRVEYVNSETGERTASRPAGVLLRPALGQHATDEETGGLDGAVEDGMADAPQTAAERQRREAAAAVKCKEEAAAFLQQSECSRCHNFLLDPRVLRPCQHVQCAPCVASFARYHGRCGVCGSGIAGTQPSFELAASIQERLAQGLLDPSARQRQTERLEQVRQSLSTVGPKGPLIIEFGNTANPAGPPNPRIRRAMSSFVRVVSPHGIACVRDVVFDINPGSNMGGQKMNRPDGKQFSLERSMARPFPCYMTVTFARDLGLPPIEIQFWTQHTEASYARRLVVCGFPPASSPSSCKPAASTTATASGRGNLKPSVSSVGLPNSRKTPGVAGGHGGTLGTSGGVTPVALAVDDGRDVWLSWTQQGAAVIEKN